MFEAKGEDLYKLYWVIIGGFVRKFYRILIKAIFLQLETDSFSKLPILVFLTI